MAGPQELPKDEDGNVIPREAMFQRLQGSNGRMAQTENALGKLGKLHKYAEGFTDEEWEQIVDRMEEDVLGWVKQNFRLLRERPPSGSTGTGWYLED